MIATYKKKMLFWSKYLNWTWLRLQSNVSKEAQGKKNESCKSNWKANGKEKGNLYNGINQHTSYLHSLITILKK